MHWSKRAPRSLGALVLMTAVVVGPVATAADAADSVVTSTSVLAPNLVSSGRTAFYSATWTNVSTSTLANPVAVITLPAGSALAPGTSPGCTTATTSGSLAVSCPQHNLASGATLTQQLLVKMPAATTTAAVTAALTADERGSDQNKSHQDVFPAPDQPLTILGGAADAAGGCISNGDQALATRDGLGKNNPLITTAALTGPSGAPPCVAVTVREEARTSPTDACGAGARCTTDIAVTDYIPIPLITQAPSSPVQLTFTVLASNKNLTWYKSSPGKNPSAVPDCPGATDLPPEVNACVNSRSKTGSTSVRLGVLWREGPDPRWTG